MNSLFQEVLSEISEETSNKIKKYLDLLDIESELKDFKDGKQDLQETITHIGFLMLQREGRLVKKVLAKVAEQALVRIERYEDREEVISKVSGTFIDSQWIEVDKDSILNLNFNNENTI